MSESNGYTANRLKAERDLKANYGVKSYVNARRCPACGHNSFTRREDNVCLACAIRGTEPVFVENDPPKQRHKPVKVLDAAPIREYRTVIGDRIGAMEVRCA